MIAHPNELSSSEKTLIPKKLLEHAEIQELIVSLNDKNVKEVCEKIKEDKKINSQDFVYFVADEIIRTVPLRPKKWDRYLRLIHMLSFANTADTYSDEFKKRILDGLFKTTNEWCLHEKAPLYYFARLGFMKEIFTISEIISKISSIPLSLPCQYFVAFSFFAPDIYRFNNDIYQQFYKNVIRMADVCTNVNMVESVKIQGSHVHLYSRYNFQNNPAIFEALCNSKELVDNDFLELYSLIETGCYYDTPEYYIFNDNVEGLESKYSETFDYNARVLPTPFHPAMFVQWKPTYLEFAAFYGSHKCFMSLLKHRSRTAFIPIMATAGGHKSILEECLKLEEPFENCIKIAATFRNLPVLKWIIDKRSNDFKLKREINYCLGRAAFTNYLYMLEFCVKNGGDINSRDENGQTPLHLAVQSSSCDTLRMLLSLPHIHIKKKNIYGWNPHSIAEDKEVLEIMKQAHKLREDRKKKIELKKKSRRKERDYPQSFLFANVFQ